MDEWRGVARFGLGLWDGLVDEFEALAERVARIAQGGQYIETKALVAKLLLYEGRLAEAWVRFADLSELALRRPGESWRVWGPMGQAEVGLCLGTLPEAELHRLYERAAAAMSAMENTDAAYTLRRLGLAARLAWRRGDLAAAGAAVETGIAAAARMQAPWWAQEGIAGLGDVLLALWRRERDSGGAPGPLAALWPTYERALRSHVRRFPPGVVTLQRLRGERALLDGKRSQGLARLRRAVEMGERQGLRVELARARDALAAAEPGSDAASRAAALWNELRAAPVG
jgi:hypothetical protein